jgi:hypothetical protein
MSKLVNMARKYVRLEVLTAVTITIVHGRETSGSAEGRHSQLDERMLPEGF